MGILQQALFDHQRVGMFGCVWICIPLDLFVLLLNAALDAMVEYWIYYDLSLFRYLLGDLLRYCICIWGMRSPQRLQLIVSCRITRVNKAQMTYPVGQWT